MTIVLRRHHGYQRPLLPPGGVVLVEVSRYASGNGWLWVVRSNPVAGFGGRFLGVSDPLCLSSSSALDFFWLFFLCPPPFNQDDWQLLAHAMASDLSVAWQCSQREQLVFSLHTKLHTLIGGSFQKLFFAIFRTDAFRTKSGAPEEKQLQFCWLCRRRQIHPS
jgi:hypothetical protein